jgi:hypothetical protein
MLEEVLREHTSAIRELAAVIKAFQTKSPTVAELYAQQKAVHDEPPLTPAESAAAMVAVLAEAKSQPQPAAPVEQQFESDISYEQVVYAIRRIVADGKRDLVVDALAQFGCTKATDLRAEQFEEFLDALNSIAG